MGRIMNRLSLVGIFALGLALSSCSDLSLREEIEKKVESYTSSTTIQAGSLTTTSSTSTTTTTTTVPDTTKPTVLSTTPSSGATGVNIRHPVSVSIRFSEAMDSATIGTTFGLTSGIRLRNESGSYNEFGTVSYNVSTRVATLSLGTVDLGALNNYKIELYGTVKDVAGNTLTPVTFAFTTRDRITTLTYQDQYVSSNSTYSKFVSMLVNDNDAYIATQNGTSLTYGSLIKINTGTKTNLGESWSNFWGNLRNGPGTMVQNTNSVFVAHSNSQIRAISKGDGDVDFDDGSGSSHVGGISAFAGDGDIIKIVGKNIVGYSTDLSGSGTEMTNLLTNGDDPTAMITVGPNTYIAVPNDNNDDNRIVSVYSGERQSYISLGADLMLTPTYTGSGKEITSLAFSGATSNGNTLIAGTTANNGLLLINAEDDVAGDVLSAVALPNVQDVATNGTDSIIAVAQVAGVSIVDIRSSALPQILVNTQVLSNSGGQPYKIAIRRDPVVQYTYWVYVLSGSASNNLTKFQVYKLTIN